MKMDRNTYIEKRVAEGFTADQAGREYDGTIDPSIAQAQEQKIPTRGEMIEQIHKARQNNPDKRKWYEPNFSYSEKYLALKKEVEKLFKSGAENYQVRKLEEQMLRIKTDGTVTDEERQTEIDKTLEMPIATVLEQRKKYEAIISDCEEKLDNFDVSAVQAKVDALTAQYEKRYKANKGNWGAQNKIKEEYNNAVDNLERDLFHIPVNALRIRRYEAKEYFLIYEARVKQYVTANRTLIEEEIQNAKRMEVRGSLVELAGYVEGGLVK